LHFGKTEIFLQKGLDRGQIDRLTDLPVGQDQGCGRNFLSHSARWCRQSSPAEVSLRYKWAAHLISNCEHIQIEAFGLRLVYVRLQTPIVHVKLANLHRLRLQ
jgi:hypothetical protein